jgi:hypothetical protein
MEKSGFQNPNLESRGLEKNLANRARKARSLKHRARTDRLYGLPPHFEGQVVRVKGNYLLAAKGYNQPSPFPKVCFSTSMRFLPEPPIITGITRKVFLKTAPAGAYLSGKRPGIFHQQTAT